jgi:hypothetical protein
LISVLSLLLLKQIVATTAVTAFQSSTPYVKAGLGTGCPFDASVSPASRVSNLTNFISARSGVVLSKTVQNRLISLETQTMYQGRPTLSESSLSKAISDTWLSVVGQLSDGQIQGIGYFSRTLVDVPFSPIPGVMVRASGQITFGNMSDWMSKACAYRDSSTADAIAARAATPTAIYNEVDQRLLMYSAALSNQWSGASLTPCQAFLLGYSVASDDYLIRSSAALTQMMQGVEAYIHQTWPSCQTSCANRTPYGYMGYLYSTHTPNLFNDGIQNSLIDRL